jgi:hypothetical protein
VIAESGRPRRISRNSRPTAQLRYQRGATSPTAVGGLAGLCGPRSGLLVSSRRDDQRREFSPVPARTSTTANASRPRGTRSPGFHLLAASPRPSAIAPVRSRGLYVGIPLLRSGAGRHRRVAAPSGGADMILAPVRAPDSQLQVGVPYCGTTGSGPNPPGFRARLLISASAPSEEHCADDRAEGVSGCLWPRRLRARALPRASRSTRRLSSVGRDAAHEGTREAESIVSRMSIAWTLSSALRLGDLIPRSATLDTSRRQIAVQGLEAGLLKSRPPSVRCGSSGGDSSFDHESDPVQVDPYVVRVGQDRAVMTKAAHSSVATTRITFSPPAGCSGARQTPWSSVFSAVELSIHLRRPRMTWYHQARLNKPFP